MGQSFWKESNPLNLQNWTPRLREAKTGPNTTQLVVAEPGEEHKPPDFHGPLASVRRPPQCLHTNTTSLVGLIVSC